MKRLLCVVIVALMLIGAPLATGVFSGDKSSAKDTDTTKTDKQSSQEEPPEEEESVIISNSILPGPVPPPPR